MRCDNLIKQEVNTFIVNNLDDVYDFCNQYIEQDCRIISVCFNGHSSPKEALIVYEYEEEK